MDKSKYYYVHLSYNYVSHVYQGMLFPFQKKFDFKKSNPQIKTISKMMIKYRIIQWLRELNTLQLMKTHANRCKTSIERKHHQCNNQML